MASYRITYSPAARKDILKLEKSIQKTIIERIESLGLNTHPPESVKIDGSKDFIG